jgi:hypothetical protein
MTPADIFVNFHYRSWHLRQLPLPQLTATQIQYRQGSMLIQFSYLLQYFHFHMHFNIGSCFDICSINLLLADSWDKLSRDWGFVKICSWKINPDYLWTRNIKILVILQCTVFVKWYAHKGTNKAHIMNYWIIPTR